MTQIGLMVEGQYGLTWARWQRLLKTVEDSGYQCLFRSDHYTINPPDQESLEAWISLTYAAAETKRIEFGTLVSPTTFRHPTMTARMAAQVDDLSIGRLVLGLGAGWNEKEHRQFGLPFYDRKTRFDMLGEALEVTTRLFHEVNPITYEGKHFSLHDAILLPRPNRPGGPPILIGGKGQTRTLPLVAKYAKEWNVPFISAEEYRVLSQKLDTFLIQNGRKPSDVKRSYMVEVVFAENEAAKRAKLAERPSLGEPGSLTIFGTPSEIVDRLAKYVEVGVERFMLQWLALDDLNGIENLAKTVLPQFHKP